MHFLQIILRILLHILQTKMGHLIAPRVHNKRRETPLDSTNDDVNNNETPMSKFYIIVDDSNRKMLQHVTCKQINSVMLKGQWCISTQACNHT